MDALTSYLVRHAKAGSRERWTRPDDERPLTPPGLRQAEGLVRQLAAAQVRRVASSPYVRCVETVAPLASARGLEVEIADGLAEGAGPDWAVRVLSQANGAVLCSHADVVGEVVMALADGGARLEGGLRWAKGSTWIFESEAGRIVSGRYLPPPE